MIKYTGLLHAGFEEGKARQKELAEMFAEIWSKVYPNDPCPLDGGVPRDLSQDDRYPGGPPIAPSSDSTPAPSSSTNPPVPAASSSHSISHPSSSTDPPEPRPPTASSAPQPPTDPPGPPATTTFSDLGTSLSRNSPGAQPHATAFSHSFPHPPSRAHTPPPADSPSRPGLQPLSLTIPPTAKPHVPSPSRPLGFGFAESSPGFQSASPPGLSPHATPLPTPSSAVEEDELVAYLRQHPFPTEVRSALSTIVGGLVPGVAKVVPPRPLHVIVVENPEHRLPTPGEPKGAFLSETILDAFTFERISAAFPRCIRNDGINGKGEVRCLISSWVSCSSTENIPH